MCKLPSCALLLNCTAHYAKTIRHIFGTNARVSLGRNLHGYTTAESIRSTRVVMAVWKIVEMNSSRKRTSIYQETPQRFSESLIAELGHGRHMRYKDVSKDLNNLINKEEEDTPIATPPFNKDRLKLIVQRIIRQQFILKDEDGDPIKWVYDPNKNLEMCQKIAKAVQDKVRSYNYTRYRIVSLCSIVEKDGQGICYKMKYIIDPYLDNYVQYVHDMARFWIISTLILVHKD